MIVYKNISGDSGVRAYGLGPDYIVVQFTRDKFSRDKMYLYTYESAGSSSIDEMKKLAEGGKGLCTYIAKNVKKKFAKMVDTGCLIVNGEYFYAI